MGKLSAPLFKADLGQITAHLNRLFSRCADEYPGGMFEIRCIHPGDKPVRAQLFDTTPEGFDRGAAWAVEMNEGEGYNAYVGVNPRKPGTSPTAAAGAKDVEIAFFQFADIDSEESVNLLKTIRPLEYTFAVMTGRVPNPRPHIYWELETPTRNMTAWRDQQAAIDDHFKSDSVKDPPRIMRLAGSVNYPSQKKMERGYRTEVVTIRTEYDGESREPVTSEALHAAYPAVAKAPPKASDGPRELNLKPIDPQKCLKNIANSHNLHNNARDLINHMVGTGEPEWLVEQTVRKALEPVSDGGTLAQMPGLIASAQKLFGIPDTGVESLDDVVKRLALLTRGEYEQCRKAEAKKLDVRPAYLDAEVKAAHGNGEDGGGFKLYEPEPWDEEVDGDDLLDRVVAAIREYVIMPEHVAETAALWIVHTHAFDIWQVTPRLAISAPTMGSGKSVMLDVLGCLVPRPLEADNLSTAVMFRAVDAYRPSLMVDEVDTFLRDNDELRGILNSGYRKGGQVLRCEGDSNELKAFQTFAPVATAGIGRLPGTLADRSIHAELQRKRPDERTREFRYDRIDHLRDLARQAARWVEDNRSTLRESEPPMPAGLFNRKADNWRPLLAIADAAGGEWPVRARVAAVALSATDAYDVESFKVQLLADTQTIFGEVFEDRIKTKDILSRLHEMEDRPWSDFRRGNPITARQLGDMLRSFKIVASSRRFADGTNAKGYLISNFENAFSRYLPDSAVTTSQANETAGYSDFQSVTNEHDVTERNSLKAMDIAGCDVVTDKKGGTVSRG